MTPEFTLTAEHRRILSSAMDRILPGGDGPSASDVNAIGYADWVMQQPHFAPHRRYLVTGLALLDAAAISVAGHGFAECDATVQNSVLRVLHNTPHPTTQRFFRLLVGLTLTGAFSPPAYGGNRDGAGWRHIGYEPRFVMAGQHSQEGVG